MTDRKELKQEYARAVRMMGVFQVKNTVNGKIFLDCGINLEGKLNSCRFQLQQGGHMNRELQADFNAAGADAFVFETLDTLKPDDDDRKKRDELDLLMRMWLDKLQPYGDAGYNRPRP